MSGRDYWMTLAESADTDDVRERILTGYKEGKPFTPYLPTIAMPAPVESVLDFGCGVGRVLRQFAPEAREAEFWGCDLDRPSLDWLEANLSPPFHFFESAEAPGLPQADGSFDLRDDASGVEIHLGTGHYPGYRADRLFGVSTVAVASPELAPLAKPEDLAQHVLLHDDAMDRVAGAPASGSWVTATCS